MSLPRVTGVIWWRMGVSHYESLFRRARGDEPRRGFTRDYLQASGIAPTLREMFAGREPPYEPLVYRWSAGAYTNGRIYAAADFGRNERLAVGQFLGGVPPEPWQIGDPLSNPAITLPGDPGAAIPGAALAQWEERIEPMRPWLTMAQLDGSQGELHLRAYLELPPAELAEASLDRVPEALRERMTARTRVGAGAAAGDLPDLWFDPSDFRDPWKLAPDVAPRGPSLALVPIPVTGFGSEYRPGDEEVETAAPEPFDVDPDQRDRGTRAHNRTQNALAEALRARRLEPLSSDGEPDFDLAWEDPDGAAVVAEVKSVTSRNAERQMRLGLGQVLRYRNLVEASGRAARALLVLSDAPVDRRWVDLCRELGVGLIWMPELSPMLDEWLVV
jgi:hypothetical protein